MSPADIEQLHEATNSTRPWLPVAGRFAGRQKDRRLTAVSVAAMVAPGPAAAGQLTPKVLLAVAGLHTYDPTADGGLFQYPAPLAKLRAQRCSATRPAQWNPGQVCTYLLSLSPSCDRSPLKG